MGSAALAAAVVLPMFGDPNFPQGILEYVLFAGEVRVTVSKERKASGTRAVLVTQATRIGRLTSSV